MHIGSMELTEADIQAIDRLQTLIPDQIFDAHAHLYDCSIAPNTAGPGSIFHQCGSVVTVKDYKWLQGRLYGGDRKIRLNIVSVPDESMADLSNGRRDASTRFLCSQLETYPIVSVKYLFYQMIKFLILRHNSFIQTFAGLNAIIQVQRANKPGRQISAHIYLRVPGQQPTNMDYASLFIWLRIMLYLIRTTWITFRKCVVNIPMRS